MNTFAQRLSHSETWSKRKSLIVILQSSKEAGFEY